MSYSDNSDEVARWWEQNAPTRDHTLELQNVTVYAQYLHDKHGYYVFNDEKSMATVLRWLGETLGAGVPITDDTIAMALDAAAYDVIAFLQSLTGEMRPPVGRQNTIRRVNTYGEGDGRMEDVMIGDRFVTRRYTGGRATKKAEGPRRAHPGSWADVTGRLAAAYQHLVNEGALTRHPYSG